MTFVVCGGGCQELVGKGWSRQKLNPVLEITCEDRSLVVRGRGSGMAVFPQVSPFPFSSMWREKARNMDMT